ncbi:hypothetical protein CQW23_19556 [Capsicum baccatum]|uniref:Lipoxygenase domain-containing protein n=1 Tax=Capsicum baccatum TaxID=33114 RepID=A0A2G2W651_CAPBA|nr:hypothetical protein CQW23_19556 [Capsicum baccatum]
MTMMFKMILEIPKAFHFFPVQSLEDSKSILIEEEEQPEDLHPRLAWLPSETPAALCSYREDVLLHLRETGTRKLEEWDRVYNHVVYSNFGDSYKSPLLARPILGGYKEYPYPRRGRTRRPPSKTGD